MVDCCFLVTIAKHSRQELDENNSRKRCPGGLIRCFNGLSSLSITSTPSRIYPMLCFRICCIRHIANHENFVSSSFAKEQSDEANIWMSHLILSLSSDPITSPLIRTFMRVLARRLDWELASDDEERLGCANSSSRDHAGWGEYAVKWPWCIELLPPLPPRSFIMVLVRVMELSEWRGGRNWWLNSPDTTSYQRPM